MGDISYRPEQYTEYLSDTLSFFILCRLYPPVRPFTILIYWYNFNINDGFSGGGFIHVGYLRFEARDSSVFDHRVKVVKLCTIILIFGSSSVKNSWFRTQTYYVVPIYFFEYMCCRVIRDIRRGREDFLTDFKNG